MKARLLRLICSRTWTVKEVPRRQARTRRLLLFIRIPLRTGNVLSTANDRMLRPFESGASGVTKIASSGLDGKIVVWDLAASGLEGRMGGMNIRH